MNFKELNDEVMRYLNEQRPTATGKTIEEEIRRTARIIQQQIEEEIYGMPHSFEDEPPPLTIERWDEMTRGKRIRMPLPPDDLLFPPTPYFTSFENMIGFGCFPGLDPFPIETESFRFSLIPARDFALADEALVRLWRVLDLCEVLRELE